MSGMKQSSVEDSSPNADIRTAGPVELWIRRISRIGGIVLFFVLFAGVLWELRTSTIQAQIFASQAKKLTFRTEPGPSPAITYPKVGPFDHRNGYSRLPAFLKRLDQAGYEIAAQARFSPWLYRMTRMGLSPPYREKTQAGLNIGDEDGTPIFQSRHPKEVYTHFSAVPPTVSTTLLYIENRELLDLRHPKQNPTIEWDRLALAAYELLSGGSGSRGPGASTLATQIEKMRHSPNGITASPGEKLRQMLSASLRAYRQGEETLPTRRAIVVEYLNALPLAATQGWGEVIGLADGLHIWYGADFAQINGLLERGAYYTPPEQRGARALAYKQVLSLLIAQRRPSYFLIHDRDGLRSLTDSYLRILARDGIITPEFRDDALAQSLVFRDEVIPPDMPPRWRRQAADIIRASLIGELGVPDYYQLDQLDLAVTSSLNLPTQRAVDEVLHGLKNSNFAKLLDLVGPRKLSEENLSKVLYSVTFYERGKHANWLRFQASNLDQPFNFSDGARLDLGSTAKLRTLVTYLDIMARLYDRYGPYGRKPTGALTRFPHDALTVWAVQRLTANPRISLSRFLTMALERRYSANPNQSFYTGGGLHRFSNFSKTEDGRSYDVATALQKSVNLVFVRILRDIVYYYRARLPGYSAELLKHRAHPLRLAYLERFADYEGSKLLEGFYRDYTGKRPSAAFSRLIRRANATPRANAAVLRYIYSRVDPPLFGRALRMLLPKNDISTKDAAKLYTELAPDRFDVVERSYIAGLHPLELWLVKYLRDKPDASLQEVLKAGKSVRIASYEWLYRTRNKTAQDLRIRTMLEIDAFHHIEKDWQRVGYPFDLVPSYATALGSSADRPAALSTLLGIILNHGVSRPMRRIESLHFAANTPYETVVVPGQEAGKRVLPAEVADAVHRVMLGTVKSGTARRAFGSLRDREGKPMEIGGKTGTGDNRFKIYRDGELVGERALSRSAAFIFTIGDRFFGVITAHVQGPEAIDYHFTSALAVQLFASLAPIIQPMIDKERGALGTVDRRKEKPWQDDAQPTPRRDISKKPPARTTPVRLDEMPRAPQPWGERDG